MTPDDPQAQDKPADEFTGNYGRGGYYGYTYDQEAYNRQVKKAAKAKKPGTPCQCDSDNQSDSNESTRGEGERPASEA